MVTCLKKIQLNKVLIWVSRAGRLNFYVVLCLMLPSICIYFPCLVLFVLQPDQQDPGFRTRSRMQIDVLLAEGSSATENYEVFLVFSTSVKYWRTLRVHFTIVFNSNTNTQFVNCFILYRVIEYSKQRDRKDGQKCYNG